MVRRIEIPFNHTLQSSNHYPTDNPLEEVWDRLQRFGSVDFLTQNFKADGDLGKWEDCKKYSELRLSQAIELRNSAKGSTFLTKPLLLYYSFLNILRSYLALKHEFIPSKGHGLRYLNNSNILLSKAVVQKGSFFDYVSYRSSPVNLKDEFTLKEVLERINELNIDLFSNKNFTTKVYNVHIDTFTSGWVQLSFLHNYSNLDSDFKDIFPSISKDFHKVSDQIYKTDDKDDFKIFNNIKNYVHKNFETNLLLNNRNQYEKWYLVNTKDPKNNLSRSSYYFLAMFILSNIVRYEPESLMEIYKDQADIYWLIKNFLKIAERYYPQLMLIELNNDKSIYF